MSKDGLSDRKRALENTFFAKQEEKLIAGLRAAWPFSGSASGCSNRYSWNVGAKSLRTSSIVAL